VLPQSCAPRVTAEFLLDRYLKLVRNWTWSLIRPELSAEGVQFRILNTSLALLSFGPAEYPSGEGSGEVHLRVNGGLLVQPRECDRGLFSLYAEEVAEGVRVRVQLARASRLRRLLYRVTQAYLHKVVTVRYLAELYRELTGEKPNPRVLQVKVREGKET